MDPLQGIDVFSILVGMVAQTVIIARVNRANLENVKDQMGMLWGGIDEAKKTAGNAHRRIDHLLRHQKT